MFHLNAAPSPEPINLIELAEGKGDPSIFFRLISEEPILISRFRSPNGSTLLHFAATAFTSNSFLKPLSTLINVNTRNKLGNTPLHYAIKAKAISNANALISLGADMNIKNYNNESPLQIVLRKPHEITRHHFLKALFKFKQKANPVLLDDLDVNILLNLTPAERLILDKDLRDIQKIPLLMHEPVPPTTIHPSIVIPESEVPLTTTPPPSPLISEQLFIPMTPMALPEPVPSLPSFIYIPRSVATALALLGAPTTDLDIVTVSPFTMLGAYPGESIISIRQKYDQLKREWDPNRYPGEPDLARAVNSYLDFALQTISPSEFVDFLLQSTYLS